MRLVFFETPVFTRLLPDYMSDESYRRLQQTLMERPESGKVIPATGGFRKIRWQDSRTNKGRRGGLRIIYYHLQEDQQIWFFTLYGKNEVTDLAEGEKTTLKQAIEAELKARRQTQ